MVIYIYKKKRLKTFFSKKKKKNNKTKIMHISGSKL